MVWWNWWRPGSIDDVEGKGCGLESESGMIKGLLFTYAHALVPCFRLDKSAFRFVQRWEWRTSRRRFAPPFLQVETRPDSKRMV